MKLKAIITLVILSPFLTEVVTGSSPVPLFFTFSHFLLLTLLGYGLPVLVIREYIVRNKIGLLGTILVGLGFGVYNEGLWAKTLVSLPSLPVQEFAGYGVVFGIGWPWSLTISFGHALLAVLTPILLVHYFFPAVAQVPWLGKKKTIFIAAVLLALGSATFINLPVQNVRGTAQQLVIFLLLILGLAALAKIWKGTEIVSTGPVRARTVFLGFLIGVFYLLANKRGRQKG